MSNLAHDWQHHLIGTVSIPPEIDGCEECNRKEAKPWPIYTVNYHGVECCAKCLAPMSHRRR